MPIAVKPLYVKLAVPDRDQLDRLTAESSAAAGRPITVADIIRQLVRDAAKKGKPIRIPDRGRA